MVIRSKNSVIVPLVLLVLLLSFTFALPALAHGFTAVWRPSETAPSTAYNYFYLIHEETGNIYALFTNGRNFAITDIVKVANLYTGEVTHQNLTAEWVDNNPHVIGYLSELFGVEAETLKQYYQDQLSHRIGNK